MNTDIPKPITFNPVKHHLPFIQEKVKEWQKKDWSKTELELRTIGNNLLDLYLGSLSVQDICNESLRFFTENEIVDCKYFQEWLQPKEYRKIVLSDKSVWIIKKGDDLLRYIHIHPGKNSVKTARVRATTLKTVIALLVQLSQSGQHQLPSLTEVNQIRREYLQLSPIKKLHREKGILRLWQIFNRP